jgi:Tol biopolymer transport system component
MRRALKLSVFAALCAGLLGCSSAPRQVQQYTIQDFLGTTSYIGASFAPDNGKLLVSSNADGVFNAYAIPVDGSEPEELTKSEESVFVRGYFPSDERFLYMSDQGGNELDHIYVHELDGSTKDLTPGEKLKATFMGWAWDDRSFYIATNERDPRYFDVYEYMPDTYERTMVRSRTTRRRSAPMARHSTW